MLDAFASLFKLWSPGNCLTKSLFKFTNSFKYLLVFFFPCTLSRWIHDPWYDSSEILCCSLRLLYPFLHYAHDPRRKLSFCHSVHETLSTLQASNETCTWLWGCDYIHPILKYVLRSTDLSGTYTVAKHMRKHSLRPNQSLCLKKGIPFSRWSYEHDLISYGEPN